MKKESFWSKNIYSQNIYSEKSKAIGQKRSAKVFLFLDLAFQARVSVGF